MSADTGKAKWSASDEPMLNVPQSERSDDTGEHSEVRSADVERRASNEEPESLQGGNRAPAPSNTAPEAPLVSPEADARNRHQGSADTQDGAGR
jgi:hypothetical protein